MDFSTRICTWGNMNTWALFALPLIAWLVWWWNDIWYANLKLKLIPGTKLPPGHMGLPFLGEMLQFLCYFKLLRMPDDYITSKRHK